MGMRRPRILTLVPYTTLFRSVEPLRATGWSDGELTVEVPSGFFRERLKERHLVRRLERALEQATGTPATVLLQVRSEEHTSELQSLTNLVCRLLLEKKNKQPT